MNTLINSISFKHGRFLITAERWSDGQLEIQVDNTQTGESRDWQDLSSKLQQAEILVNVTEKLGLSFDDTDMIVKAWIDHDTQTR